MRRVLGSVWTIARKDVLLELRNREIVLALLVFSFIVLVVFNFAVALTPANAGVVGPGVLWVAITFASVIGLNRSFVIEKEGGALDGRGRGGRQLVGSRSVAADRRRFRRRLRHRVAGRLPVRARRLMSGQGRKKSPGSVAQGKPFPIRFVPGFRG